MEPEYVYRKGEGWVPFYADEGYLVTCPNGNRFRLTDRTPNPGERVLQISRNHPSLTVNGKIDMTKVVQWFSEVSLDFRRWHLVGKYGYAYNHLTVVVERAD